MAANRRTLSSLLLFLLFFMICAAPLHMDSAFFSLADRLHRNGGSAPDPGATGVLEKKVDSASTNWPTHFTAPHYEIGRYLRLEQRSRLHRLVSIPRTLWGLTTEIDRRMTREAVDAYEATCRSTWKSYVEESLREMTEGGKNVVSQVYNLRDWQDAILPFTPV